MANALSPAQVVSVQIDEEERIASVTVPERMLSLAIGREGQNARLAAKLTGWRIDIRSDSGTESEDGEGVAQPDDATKPDKVEAEKADEAAEPEAEKAADSAEPEPEPDAEKADDSAEPEAEKAADSAEPEPEPEPEKADEADEAAEPEPAAEQPADEAPAEDSPEVPQ